VARVAQPPVSRPLAELDLRDEPRLDEVRPSRRLASGERRSSARERREQLAQAIQLRFIEAGADLAGVLQLAAVRVMDAQLERAETVLARSSALGPAPDHELLAARVLDLQPGAVAAAGRVARVE